MKGKLAEAAIIKGFRSKSLKGKRVNIAVNPLTY